MPRSHVLSARLNRLPPLTRRACKRQTLRLGSSRSASKRSRRPDTGKMPSQCGTAGRYPLRRSRRHTPRHGVSARTHHTMAELEAELVRGRHLFAVEKGALGRPWLRRCFHLFPVQPFPSKEGGLSGAIPEGTSPGFWPRESRNVALAPTGRLPAADTGVFTGGRPLVRVIAI